MKHALENRGKFADLIPGAMGFAIFIIPGWVLSLPFVIFFDRIDGWRFWVLGSYGTLLGPAIILVWAIVCKVTEGTPITYFAPFAGAALVIAFIATGLYLSAAGHFSRDSIEQTQS